MRAFFFFNKFIYLFIYFWLCWVSVSVRRGLSPVAASGGHSSSRCAGLSLPRPLLLQSTGSRRAGSVAVAHGPSCSAACGIFPDQGSNPCPLHWQADSQPLRHQGSPSESFFAFILLLIIWASRNTITGFQRRTGPHPLRRNRGSFSNCNVVEGDGKSEQRGRHSRWWEPSGVWKSLILTAVSIRDAKRRK